MNTTVKLTGSFDLPLSDQDDGTYEYARNAAVKLDAVGLPGAASIWADEAQSRKGQ